jgi:hypothetical protein
MKNIRRNYEQEVERATRDQMNDKYIHRFETQHQKERLPLGHKHFDIPAYLQNSCPKHKRGQSEIPCSYWQIFLDGLIFIDLQPKCAGLDSVFCPRPDTPWISGFACTWQNCL